MDIIVNSIWGKIVWYRNIGTQRRPKLAAQQPIEVEWAGRPPKPAWNWWRPEGQNLATQWRTTPVVMDFDNDGLNDLIMLDHEGYLALFQRVKRNRKLLLLPGRRIFSGERNSVFDSIQRPRNEIDGLLRMNDGVAGKSGRRKFCFVDWDLDGLLDILVNSQNINFLQNVSKNQTQCLYRDRGMVDDRILAGHTTSPTLVDWNRDGLPDLLAGAEDGFLYYLENPHPKGAVRIRQP
jgi:hypothetical protein